MICISLTSFITSKQIRLNDKLIASRIYVSKNEVSTFPNCLIFNASPIIVAILRQELLGAGEVAEEDRWLADEFDVLEADNDGVTGAKIMVPFILRSKEEAHTSFKSKQKRSNNELTLELGSPVLKLNGVTVPSICTGCKRVTELGGRVCPDFVPNNLSCLKTGLITNDTSKLLLNDKGELEYAESDAETTPDEAIDGEQLENSTGGGTAGA